MPRTDRILALVASLACLMGCGERSYDRVEVVGMLVPITDPIPPARPTLVSLPPMPELGVAGDRPDGSVDLEIDQKQFLHDHGFAFPSYVPPAEEPTDQRVLALGRLAEDLAAVRALLATVFTAAPAAADGTTPINPGAALVLPPQEWEGLTARLVVVTKAIDQLRAASAAPGAPAPGTELWEGMDDACQRVLVEAGGLGEDGVFAQLRRHPRHGQVVEAQLGRVRDAARTLAETVSLRSAGELAAALGSLQRSCAALTSGPTAALAWGPHQGEEPDFSRLDRDASRRRLARLTEAFLDVAGLWSANSARLVAQSPAAAHVYRRPEVIR